jgi:peptidoglycan/xylan/chitin deacetylase (PgdA/CDA1 family)
LNYASATKEDNLNILVLCYHQISNEENIYAINIETFDIQMSYLKKNNYNTITLDNYALWLKGEMDLPPKPVLITFDDGFESVYNNAFPILKKYNFVGNLFLITNTLNKDKYLTISQIQEMIHYGFSIGSHSVNHKKINSIKKIHDKNELIESKKSLKEMFNKNIDFFAYPYGIFDETTEEIAEKAGYLGAFTIIKGFNSRDTNSFELYRFQITNTDVFNVNIFQKILTEDRKLLAMYYKFGAIKSYKNGELRSAEIYANNLLKLNPNENTAKQIISEISLKNN